MARKHTLHISGSFAAGGDATIKYFRYGCQTCAGDFDIEIPFEVPGGSTETTVSARAEDMGEGKHKLVSRVKKDDCK